MSDIPPDLTAKEGERLRAALDDIGVSNGNGNHASVGRRWKIVPGQGAELELNGLGDAERAALDRMLPRVGRLERSDGKLIFSSSKGNRRKLKRELAALEEALNRHVQDGPAHSMESITEQVAGGADIGGVFHDVREFVEAQVHKHRKRLKGVDIEQLVEEFTQVATDHLSPSSSYHNRYLSEQMIADAIDLHLKQHRGAPDRVAIEKIFDKLHGGEYSGLPAAVKPSRNGVSVAQLEQKAAEAVSPPIDGQAAETVFAELYRNGEAGQLEAEALRLRTQGRIPLPMVGEETQRIDHVFADRHGPGTVSDTHGLVTLDAAEAQARVQDALNKVRSAGVVREDILSRLEGVFRELGAHVAGDEALKNVAGQLAQMNPEAVAALDTAGIASMLYQAEHSAPQTAAQAAHGISHSGGGGGFGGYSGSYSSSYTAAEEGTAKAAAKVESTVARGAERVEGAFARMIRRIPRGAAVGGLVGAGAVSVWMVAKGQTETGKALLAGGTHTETKPELAFRSGEVQLGATEHGDLGGPQLPSPAR